ncbi:hypothetical protein B4U80_04841 [Leptotrombidium deliense]|uniref:Deltamethrin resistance protein prag01 domain-containing protein n=1 Tax=Leptotrombidium deliense TaxID=299467 RepID=A0A443SVJ1_9ACAR|nr:hypothetical protein B4U80_04841 [Leptotrombidium deliense]
MAFLVRQSREVIKRALVARRYVAPKVAPSILQKRFGHDYGHHVTEDDVMVKMDRFPVPQGSWQEAYDELQSRYNKYLALSLVYLGSVIAYYFIAQPVDPGLHPPMTNKDLSFWTDPPKDPERFQWKY